MNEKLKCASFFAGVGGIDLGFEQTKEFVTIYANEFDPYPAIDRRRMDFFPPRDEQFDLLLPDGKCLKAKVCQQDSKAIMSNPNSDLGKWLLRDVFELEEGTLVTYEMLQQFNIDSVIFTKLDSHRFVIDFCELGTYERFYDEINC